MPRLPGSTCALTAVPTEASAGGLRDTDETKTHAERQRAWNSSTSVGTKKELGIKRMMGKSCHYLQLDNVKEILFCSREGFKNVSECQMKTPGDNEKD